MRFYETKVENLWIAGSIPVGFAGENIYRGIKIDCSSWLAEFPDGNLSAVWKRPDGTLYPLVTTTDGTSILWEPSTQDTAFEGLGEMQIYLTDGEIVGKSAVASVRIGHSLSSSGDPSPEPDWVITVIQAKDAAVESAELAESSAQSAVASATAAAGSASSAGQSAQSAASSATEAAGSASSAGQSAQSAGSSATAAAGSASSAGQSAQSAVASATEAASSASSAGQSAQSAASSATEAASSASSAGQSAQSAASSAAEAAESATEAADAAERIVDEKLSDYAKNDGYYKDMTVGFAENLIDTRAVGTPRKFTFDTTAGKTSITDGDGRDSSAEIEAIHGKTYRLRQLISLDDFPDSTTINGVTFTKNTDGSITVNGTATEDAQFESTTTLEVHAGRKYIIKGCPPGGYDYDHDRENFCFRLVVVANNVNDYGDGKVYIRSAGSGDNTLNYAIRIKSGFVANNLVFIPQFFDLTYMYGVGNEPESVSEFRQRFGGNYAYTPGSLMNFNGTGIKTVGFNQWDEQWELGTINTSTGEPYETTQRIRSKNFIRVLPDTTYFLSYNGDADVGSGRAVFYDANERFISAKPDLPYGLYDGYSGGEITTPPNCAYLKFSPTTKYGASYKKDICLNIEWRGYRNGEYEPYWTRTLELPTLTYFTDGMKSALAVYDELRKDKAIKRVGKYELTGTEEGYKENGKFIVIGARPGGKIYDSYNFSNVICNEYTGLQDFPDADKTIVARLHEASANDVLIRDDSFETFNDFKAYLAQRYADGNPVVLYYELAEPEITTFNPPLNLTYRVSDFGTEELLSDGETTEFVGSIKYSLDFTKEVVNLKAKAEINPLYGKKLAVNGDSICEGAGAAPGGYAKIIARNNNMVLSNNAKGGGTITADTYVEGDPDRPRHWICKTIGNMPDDSDYIIIEGGVNDVSETQLGEITPDYTSTFEEDTFYGALESIFYQLTTKFAGKKYGFIIVHGISNKMFPGGDYYEAIVGCATKWGIPLLDLTKSVPPFGLFPYSGTEEPAEKLAEVKATYTIPSTETPGAGDGTHPNILGYEKYYVPKIEAWLKTL